MINSLKHSGGSTIDVRAAATDNVYEITVKDDGKGFPSRDDASTSDGCGMTNIRSRIEGIGGEFVIGESESGGALAVIRMLLNA